MFLYTLYRTHLFLFLLCVQLLLWLYWVCYILGKIKNNDIQVRIGNSAGYFVNSISIFNAQNIKIGTEITFRHYNVSKGYIEVKVDGRIVDSKVYVK